MNAPPGEQIRGIAIPLPPGERVRWTGAPDWRSLALHTFHARKIAIYFAVLLLWRAAGALSEPAADVYFLAGAVPLVVLGMVAIACSIGLGWLTERTSVYAVTDRRVVMKIGIVVPQLFNIPFRQIESAGVRAFGDGTGDIALRLAGPDRIAYFQLWPHARGWRLGKPEPALRSIRNADEIGHLLREAWQKVVAEERGSDAAPVAWRDRMDHHAPPVAVAS